MASEETRKAVYTIFSDKVMIVLAAIAVPVIAAEFIFKAGSLIFMIAFAAGWLIWVLFLLEFVLKIVIEDKKSTYIKQHKLDSAISIVIILSPIVGIISSYFVTVPAVRLLRITRIFSATRTTTVARAAAYAGTAGVKRLDPKVKEGTYIISRLELRHVLVAMGVGEREINQLLGSLDKSHRHTNIIVFVDLLEKFGISRDKMANVLRRMEMDDVTINNVFRMVDESKIRAETGRLYDVEI